MAQLPAALAKMETVIKTNNPGYPFDYSFVDQEFGKLFKTETLIGQLAEVFSILAIFISCLGLFGLAAYTAEKRSKEIGIRKDIRRQRAGHSRTAFQRISFARLYFLSHCISGCLVDDA